MEYIINGYQPENLFRYFEEISAIPRGSGNEKGIADYLEAFAKEKGLRYYRDEHNNVAIYKPAFPGYEDKEPVMLQGHTDMVCEKNADVMHDFEKDGLKLRLNGDILSAEGTTLGGDDGAAVVMMMAVLADKMIEAPAIECLFTVEEETGLGGAESFDYSHLTAHRIINLDTEEEGQAIASCAGSMNLSFKFVPEQLSFANKAVKVTVSGLAGGHSGTDIDSGRRNSILLLGDILSALYEKMPFNLVSIEGGNKRNAIPREASAVISVIDRDEAIAEVKKIVSEIYPLLVRDDQKLKIHADRCAIPKKMMSYKDSSRVLSLLSLVPNGVLGMSASCTGLVETSSNLGVVKVNGNALEFMVYARSSVEREMDGVYRRMKRLATLLECELVFLDRCPGWAFDKNSKLQKDFVTAYKMTFPESAAEPKVCAIHAGLECGIILEKMGGGDAISIGPNMKNIHTPDETLDLRSVERVYRMLVNLLKIC